MTMDNNLQRYSDPTVVDHYEKAAGLEPCEEIIFDHWLKPGMAILDIGVGGGRTAPRLSQLSSRYVGIDYAKGMVAACKRRFPHLDFRHGDATDLGEFPRRRVRRRGVLFQRHRLYSRTRRARARDERGGARAQARRRVHRLEF